MGRAYGGSLIAADSTTFRPLKTLQQVPDVCSQPFQCVKGELYVLEAVYTFWWEQLVFPPAHAER